MLPCFKFCISYVHFYMCPVYLLIRLSTFQLLLFRLAFLLPLEAPLFQETQQN